MALFKINKGQKANLPTTYVEGYCYFTTDDGKFYIDTTNAAAGRILLNAGKADTLSTARTIRTNLGSTSTASFDGSKNITPGVTGTLPITNGGTGKTTAVDAANALVNALSESTQTTPDDSTYIILQGTGAAYRNLYYRKPVSMLWDYINSKANSVYIPYSGGTTIPSNADLNTYTTPGVYIVGGSSVAGTLTNSAFTGSGFKLIVIDGYISGRVIQFAAGNGNNWRHRCYNGSSWTDWATIYDTVNKPSLTDLTSGTLALANGGTATNLSDIPAYAIVRGNSTSGKGLYYTATANGAFYATSANGQPQFGTLPIAQGGTGSTTAAGALTNLGITATAAELNKMDGVTATTTELNYVDGVTSNIQTQLNSKLPLAGGTMTGALTVPVGADAYANPSILFGSKAKIGMTSDGNTFGFYTTGTIKLRPNGGTMGYSDGIEISTTSLIPTKNNTVSLGTSSKKWSTVYATSFSGSGASLTSLNAGNISSGTLAIARGGTGATTAAAALTALGAASANHTHSYDSLGLYDGFFRSQRDFVNGALIQTSIDYSQTSGAPWSIEIKGNSYGSLYPFSFAYQGYIWDNTIINHGGIMNGVTITGISLFNYNGNLCFYIPRQVYWQGFAVYVANESSGIQTNKVTSITDVAKPTNITKEVALTNIRYNTYGLSCSLSGTTLTITDNK